MAFSHDIHTSIVVDAPPAFVRQTFLDFESFPIWSHKYITSIKIATPTDEIATTEVTAHPAVNTKLAITMSDLVTPDPVVVPVVTNTVEEFAWIGGVSFPFALRGRHSFAFKPAGPDGRSTELIQSEHFSGFLTAYVSYGSMGKVLETLFKEFNAELKARCEATYKA